MTIEESIPLATSVGTGVGIVIWTVFFLGVSLLLGIGGDISLQPIGAISRPGVLGFWIGLIIGLIHGLLTGLAIGIFNLNAVKGSLAGLIVTQICFFVLFLLIYKHQIVSSSLDNSIFDSIATNVRGIVFFWVVFQFSFLFSLPALGM